VTCLTAAARGIWHYPPIAIAKLSHQGKEGEMGISENLPVLVALLLAMAAALVSGDTQARQGLTRFFTEALRPQTADLGTIPVTIQEVASQE
jgi:hypothetical protein